MSWVELDEPVPSPEILETVAIEDIVQMDRQWIVVTIYFSCKDLNHVLSATAYNVRHTYI